MNSFGQVCLEVGCASLLLGYLGICFCAFKVSISRGLLSLVVPGLGFGTALRHFPRLIWLWGGGIALMVVGAALT